MLDLDVWEGCWQASARADMPMAFRCECRAPQFPWCALAMIGSVRLSNALQLEAMP